MEKFIELVCKLVNSVVIATLNGFTLVTLWGWFIVTAFGVPVITIPVGIGMYMMVKFITMTQPDIYATEQEDYYRKATSYAYAKVIGVLLVGFIVKQFM